MQRGKKKSGFTVLELMTTMAVIAMLSTIAIPNIIDWLPRHRLSIAAKNLFTDIHYTRQRAASLNREYRIVFTVGSEQYQIEQGDASAGSSWPGTVDGNIRKFADSTSSYFQSGVDIVSATDHDLNTITAIEFAPLGSMTAAIITIQNEKGNTAVITSSIAGSVKM